MSFPLDGVRVLELARFQAGPRGGMLLSDLGAEVIKIERLGGEETRQHPPLVRGQSVYFSVYNRGKKSVCIDLSTPEGHAAFCKLLKTADALVHNLSPKAARKLRLTRQDCEAGSDPGRCEAIALGERECGEGCGFSERPIVSGFRRAGACCGAGQRLRGPAPFATDIPRRTNSRTVAKSN